MVHLLDHVGAQMKITKIMAMAVVLGAFSGGMLQAQSFRDQPAEFPPMSYKGKQYVDSKGCVFIRAGIDGNVTWVPRVSRKRQGVCGFKPSNVGTAAANPSTNTDTAIQITPDNGSVAQPAARVATAQVTPRPVPVRRSAPAVVRKAAPKVVRQTAPRPVVVAKAPAPVVVPSVRVPASAVPAGGACPGRSALSQRYSGSNRRGLAVRCGPQSAPIVASQPAPIMVAPQAGRVATVPGTQRQHAGVVTTVPYDRSVAGITATTRIVPKHVARNRLNTSANVAVPHGYKQVWTDGRLNPNRAEQNLEGRARMLLIWTNSVPRRLINQATGRDMTAQIPLVYPYTSIEQQRRELGEVTFATRDGQLVKRIVRNSHTARVGHKPVVSSRSAAKPVAGASARRIEATGNSYVQVGVYSHSSNAQKTARQIANMGMGARIGKTTRGGKTLLTVQAGPFGKASAPSAVSSLRRVGFSDAYIR